MKPSERGYGIRLRELRDPGIFEEDGKTYLHYTRSRVICPRSLYQGLGYPASSLGLLLAALGPGR